MPSAPPSPPVPPSPAPPLGIPRVWSVGRPARRRIEHGGRGTGEIGERLGPVGVGILGSMTRVHSGGMGRWGIGAGRGPQVVFQ